MVVARDEEDRPGDGKNRKPQLLKKTVKNPQLLL